MMRPFGVAVFVVASLTGGDWSGRASQPVAGGSVREVTTWYFYTVKWGHQDEFLDLFQRNHYPVLKARMQAGAYASVKTYVPRYHGDGRADWTFAVELVAREGATGVPPEEETIRKLYPDQAKFRREEQRRFEILAAHWDVPLNAVDLDTRVPTSR
jgi:hypothetical protein